MNISQKYLLYFTWGFFISLLLVTGAFAATKFYLLPSDAEQKIGCDYLEIKDRQVICTDNSFLVTYDLARIRNLEVVQEGKSYHVQSFTQEAINKINKINSNILETKKAHTKYTFGKSDIVQQLSVDSFSNIVQSLKTIYGHQVDSNTLNIILLGSGLIIFSIGSIGYLIATFRVGILWGLSCMFLPFVSFIFLFLHWKVAAKPFFITIFGLAIIFSTTLLGTSGSTTPHGTKSHQVSLLKNEKVDERYKCSGKIYCSEMTSCAEAKFYLRNCPGTKLDGNYDGVPCEKQWCQ